MVFAWLFLVACVHLRVDAQDLRLYGLRLSSTQEYPSEKDYNAVAEKAEEVLLIFFIMKISYWKNIFNQWEYTTDHFEENMCEPPIKVCLLAYQTVISRLSFRQNIVLFI